MKNVLKKENLMPVIVLSAICLVVAALMGVVNMVTGPIIEKAESQKVYDSLREVLDGEFETLELPTDAPSTVTGLYKVTEGGELIGHVVTVSKQGYASVISLTVGIDTEGKTTKVVITGQQETHGKDISPLIDGLSAGITSDEVSDVEHIANATKTSDYIKAAVADAFKAVGFSAPSTDDSSDDSDDDSEATELPKTDDEIKAIAAEMKEGVTLTELALDGAPDTLKKAYSADDCYFLYVVVPGAYVPVATEALIQLDLDCKVVKVNLLSWIVGHDVAAGDFADGFAGVNKDTAGDVELVTGATGTSVDFRNAVEEALVYFDEKYAVKEELPKTDDEIKAIVVEMAGKELDLSDFTVASAPDTLKRAYSAGDDGYFLYIVVPGAYVPVATEAVVHLNSGCEVVKVNLLSWIVGHGVGAGDFADGFVGADKNTVGDVELVTGATGTASDFRTALEAAIISIADGEDAKENLLVKKMKNLVPNAKCFEKIAIPENAAESLKALYKVIGFDGYVAYVITSTKYVDVETEALVHINAKGAVGNIELITWTVGHGVEPGDFAASLVGKNAKQLADVELVTSATVTAENLRDAVVDAINSVPKNNTPIIVGAAVAALAVISAITVIIIKRRRRA
ncbi:MAG: FMN-binding protein [Clostridia bacterium]|nr:FMN-binding protein [Clostridia bacterium]